MAKHLVDIDEVNLDRARAALGVSTIKDTVNEALRRVVEADNARVGNALDLLASFDFSGFDRDAAWR